MIHVHPPVAFGSHRKPEAILLPYEAYERYEALSPLQ
jgi:hypothetical protein